MGTFQSISRVFTRYTAKAREFLALLSGISKKFKGFTWNAVFASCVALAVPACAVTGAGVKMRCAFDGPVRAHCVVYPHVSRAKR